MVFPAWVFLCLFVFEYQIELQVGSLISWGFVQVFRAHTNILFPVATIYGISQVPGTMMLSQREGSVSLGVRTYFQTLF